MKKFIAGVRDIFSDSERAKGFGYRDVRFFVPYVRPFWKEGLLVLLLSAGVSALVSLVPLSGKVLIDHVALNHDPERLRQVLTSWHAGTLFPLVAAMTGSLSALVSGFVLFSLLVGAAGLARRYTVFRFQQLVSLHLQSSLFERMLRYPVSYFHGKQTGYLMARASGDVDAVHYLVSWSLPLAATGVFRVLFGFAVLFLLNSRMAMILLMISPAYVALNAFFGRRVMQASLHEYEQAAHVTRNMQEVLSGIETVKSFSAEQKEGGKLRGSLKSTMSARFRSFVLSLLADYSARGLQVAGAVLVVAMGMSAVRSSAMTIGDFVAFGAAVLALAGPVNNLALTHVTLQPLFASLARLREMLLVLPERGHEDHLSAPADMRGELRFDRVVFSYEDGRPVLDNVSFTVQPGKITALTGPSGAGKTTVVRLILKLYQPQHGAILLAGRDIRDIPSAWLREHIGIVAQETFLFHDTIENNIRYGNPGASLSEVIEAAQRARIHEEIEALPLKYQTMVGERGILLSVGQRQRISIARAFLKDPALLILDEPTSALDEKTESEFRDALKELAASRTTILVSHRAAMTGLAERTLHVADGAVREA